MKRNKRFICFWVSFEIERRADCDQSWSLSGGEKKDGGDGDEENQRQTMGQRLRWFKVVSFYCVQLGSLFYRENGGAFIDSTAWWSAFLSSAFLFELLYFFGSYLTHCLVHHRISKTRT